MGEKLTAAANPAPNPDTKESLLDAAEHLFAQYGIARASLRAITREAGANLAAVNYHFGSKQELVRAVLSRRIAPMNAERLRRLESADATDLTQVVRAFIEPAMRRIGAEPWGADFSRLVWRAFSEPDEEVREMVFQQFKTVKERFVEALTQALPELELPDIFWNFHFMVGSMVHTAGLGHVMPLLSDGLCSSDDFDEITDRLVRFASAGMQTGRGKKKNR